MQEGVLTVCACGVELDELERVCRDCGLDEDQAHFEAMDPGQRFDPVLPPRRSRVTERPTALLPIPRGAGR